MKILSLVGSALCLASPTTLQGYLAHKKPPPPLTAAPSAVQEGGIAQASDPDPHVHRRLQVLPNVKLLLLYYSQA